MSPLFFTSRRHRLWLVALLATLLPSTLALAGEPPPPPQPDQNTTGPLPAEAGLLPWTMELQRRSVEGKPPVPPLDDRQKTLVPSPLGVPTPGSRAIPQVNGQYDTSGAGPLRVEQEKDQIAMAWEGASGLSLLWGKYQAVRFPRDDGSEWTQDCFYGPWLLEDSQGNFVRGGVAVLYPAPERDDVIVCKSWEFRQGTWMDMQMGSFTKLKGTMPPVIPAEPSDDDGFE
jgi:hypothetical protein